MPYNPGSAYPRKSTYIPPVSGGAIKQAVESPSFAALRAPRADFPSDAGTAARRAMESRQFNTATAGAAMEAMTRKGFGSQMFDRGMENRGIQGKQKPSVGSKTAKEGPVSGQTFGKVEEPDLNPRDFSRVAKGGTHSNVSRVHDNLVSAEKHDTAVGGVEKLAQSAIESRLPNWRRQSRRK